MSKPKAPTAETKPKKILPRDDWFFIKWVDGRIKTVSSNRRTYYINPNYIAFIEVLFSDLRQQNMTILGMVGGVQILLDIDPKEFFKFLKKSHDRKEMQN